MPIGPEVDIDDDEAVLDKIQEALDGLRNSSTLEARTVVVSLLLP